MAVARNIMVVGGGDSAMEEALYLSRLGRQVEVVSCMAALQAERNLEAIEGATR